MYILSLIGTWLVTGLLVVMFTDASIDDSYFCLEEEPIWGILIVILWPAVLLILNLFAVMKILKYIKKKGKE